MKFELYSRVKFIGDNMKFPEIKNGDVGCIIEDYGDGCFEVEFSAQPFGITYALLAIPKELLIPV